MSRNNQTFKITASQDSVPRASLGTGTITSVNNGMITGSGTAFKTEAEIDDYIYIKAQNAFLRILSIPNDTTMYVDGNFGVPLAGSAFHITPNSKFVEIAYLISGAGSAVIDGVTLASGTDNSFNKAGKGSTGAGNKYIDPIDIDASGTEVTVTTLGG